MASIMAKPPEVQGRIMASIICWLLGVGCLLSWSSIVTIQDYYQYLFPACDYHSARVLPIVYEPVVLTVTAILTYYEATLNTRKRIISGFLLVFMSNAAIKADDEEGHKQLERLTTKQLLN
ncbi:hypothetical protein C5167_028773 [Papaver somniferum]|nr:hypothetical protein C5167_028773 [Papaver somniferum]